MASGTHWFTIFMYRNCSMSSFPSCACYSMESSHIMHLTNLLNCVCRWLYVTEDDIKNLPCFQVSSFASPKLCMLSLVRMARLVNNLSIWDSWSLPYTYFASLSGHTNFQEVSAVEVHYQSTLFWVWWVSWQNETLIAIKAPHGTTLEVPDPDEVLLRLLLIFHFVPIALLSLCSLYTHYLKSQNVQ